MPLVCYDNIKRRLLHLALEDCPDAQRLPYDLFLFHCEELMKTAVPFISEYFFTNQMNDVLASLQTKYAYEVINIHFDAEATVAYERFTARNAQTGEPNGMRPKAIPFGAFEAGTQANRDFRFGNRRIPVDTTHWETVSYAKIAVELQRHFHDRDMPFTQHRIQGQIIELRPATPNDRQDIYEWCFHSDITPCHAGPPDYPNHPIATQEEFFGEYGYQDYYFTGEKLDKGMGFLIMHQNEPVGFLSYSCFHLREGVAELDIWMRCEAHCGKGYGSDALAALGNWLQETLGIQTLIMRPSIKNQRANRTYQKVGFMPSAQPPDAYLLAEYVDVFGSGDYGADESALLVKPLSSDK